MFVSDQDFERFSYLLFRCAAADIEEICRLADVKFDDVHGSHGEACAIDEARDIAVEPNVIEPMF